MFECETCGQGFMFESQYDSHHRVHLKMQGFLCFIANCGLRFKCESELNAHLKAHSSKPIKCEYCDYKNMDQRNVGAHMWLHSDKLPFFCILCGERFKWQEQKRWHLPKCPTIDRLKTLSFNYVYWNLSRLLLLLYYCTPSYNVGRHSCRLLGITKAYIKL